MKRKISQLVGSTLLCSILAISMLASPKISLAAQENDPEGMVFLEDNKLYKYDLNGDDNVDEIKCKYTNTDEGQFIMKLYINSKLCLTRKSDIDFVFAEVCDLDKEDNFLDLFTYVAGPSDCTFDASFYRYNGKTLDSKVAFTPKDIFDKNTDDRRYRLEKLAGNGKFYISNRTFCDAIGTFNYYRPFQLKDNAIIEVSVKTYDLGEYETTYKYKAAKSFKAYEKAGSKKVVYTVKKGDKVTFDKMYIAKSGKAYLRMKNSKGKTGWIKSDQMNLFDNAIFAG